MGTSRLGDRDFRAARLVRVLHERDPLLVSRAPAVRASSSSPRANRLLLGPWSDDATFEVDGTGRVTGMRIHEKGNASGTADLAPRIGRHFQL
jgi:hypothetical protein